MSFKISDILKTCSKERTLNKSYLCSWSEYDFEGFVFEDGVKSIRPA